jgi:hypothetical protein
MTMPCWLDEMLVLMSFQLSLTSFVIKILCNFPKKFNIVIIPCDIYDWEIVIYN